MSHPASGLSEQEAEVLRTLLHQHGEAALAASLNVSKHTIGRLLAGLPCRPGSVHLVKARLAELTSSTDEEPTVG